MIKYVNALKQVFISLALLLTGCASVSVNTYQDGSPLGKGTFRLGLGAEMSPMMNYGLLGVDSTNTDQFLDFTEDLEDLSQDDDSDSTLSDAYYFWGLANILLQYGATDKIDIGIMPFSDIAFNWGSKAFVKYAIMPEDSKMQVAVVPFFGYGTMALDDTTGVGDGSTWDNEKFQYNTTYFGLDIPVSFESFYVTLKVVSDKLDGKFTYYDKPGEEFTPSLDRRTSFGGAFGFDSPGEYGRIETPAMLQKTPEGDWAPRFYIGYNKFFTFGGD